MAKTQSLKAETRQRTGTGVLNQLRREGYLPSVVYGGGQENTNIKINTKALRDLLAHSASSNILIDLELDGGKKQTAFLQDIQKNPLNGDFIHADFLAVSDDSVINASIPVVLHGEPVGVKAGGIMEQMIKDLDITCSPKNLPETLEADVEGLEVGDSLTIGGMTFPEGVSPVLAADVLVAIVNESRTTKSAGAEGDADEAATAEGGEGAAPAAE